MKDTDKGNVTRRAALAGMAGAAGTVLGRTAKGQDVQTSSDRPWVPDDPTKVMGDWASERGERSPFETAQRDPTSDAPHRERRIRPSPAPSRPRICISSATTPVFRELTPRGTS